MSDLRLQTLMMTMEILNKQQKQVKIIILFISTLGRRGLNSNLITHLLHNRKINKSKKRGLKQWKESEGMMDSITSIRVIHSRKRYRAR